MYIPVPVGAHHSLVHRLPVPDPGLLPGVPGGERRRLHRGVRPRQPHRPAPDPGLRHLRRCPLVGPGAYTEISLHILEINGSDGPIRGPRERGLDEGNQHKASAHSLEQKHTTAKLTFTFTFNLLCLLSFLMGFLFLCGRARRVSSSLCFVVTPGDLCLLSDHADHHWLRRQDAQDLGGTSAGWNLRPHRSLLLRLTCSRSLCLAVGHSVLQ